MAIKRPYQIKELSNGAMQITASSRQGIPSLHNICMQIHMANFDEIGPSIAFIKDDALTILDANIAEKVCGYFHQLNDCVKLVDI